MTYPTPIGRGRPFARRALLALSTILTSGLAVPALAQEAPVVQPAPVRSVVDENGVDLLSGRPQASGFQLSTGQAGSGLKYQSFWTENGTRHNYVFTLGFEGDAQSGQYVAGIGPKTYRFKPVQGSTIVPDAAGSGATLVYLGTPSRFLITERDGTKIYFDAYGTPPGDILYYSTEVANYGLAKRVERPSGEQLNLHYSGNRLVSVTSSNGHMLHFDYTQFPQIRGSGPDGTSRVTAIDTKIDACSPTAATCSGLTRSWPNLSYNGPETDSENKQVLFSVGEDANFEPVLIGVRRPLDVADSLSFEYDESVSYVTKATNNGATWLYSRAPEGGLTVVTVTNPVGGTRVLKVDPAKSLLVSDRDELLRLTQYEYDANNRLTKVVFPEGNYEASTYDDRGNVTAVVRGAKGGGPTQLIASAGYPTGCTNTPACNKPVWTRDPAGNQTDYSYDPATGQLLTVTAPAPTPGAARPQTRYGYTVIRGVSTLTSISTCRTNSTCVGGADEMRTTMAYDDSLRPISTTTGAGDGSLAVTTGMTYDDFGNVVAIDGPLPGAADTVVTRYNAVRQPTGVIGPDPDGGGPLKNRAARITYDGKGQAVLTETASVAGQDDSAWLSFVASQQVNHVYNADGRKTSESLSAGAATGGGAYSLTQYSYDLLGRRLCTAVRMNPGAFRAQPDACVPTSQGSNGPDRITKTNYNAASQVTAVKVGVGTPDEADEVRYSYTPNGKPASVTDANGNLTSYEYDGYDRPVLTRYPQAGNGGVSSTSDYEQLTYDANDNVVSRRLRDGQVVGYGYDALNRLVSKDRPNVAYWETDQSYAYDLQGRLMSASDSNGRVLGFVHDALGRRMSQSDNWYGFGNASMLYDAAGRRTRLTWGDGNYVSYEYDVTGAMTTVRENGGFVLASYGYDDLGRRTSLTRGNGTATTYAYDPASRLASLTQDLGGNAHDLGITFAYNPAGQIASRTSANDVYSWAGHSNVDRPYGVNGLNQLTSAGATELRYDGRGNLNSSGSTGYSYTADNQLAMSPATGLAYDPLGRLFNGVIDAGVNTTLTYDGADVIAETDQNTGELLRRYVHGPGTDEPLVWYEGTGLSNRRWLHADERGSVVAVSDGGGNAAAINRYDEFGIPQAGNIGRFQYTGQKWLPTLGLYDYKARMYSPTLGRFMQTDPIGYADGINWYNYVGGDPVNGRDTTGTECDAAACPTAKREPDWLSGPIGLDLASVSWGHRGTDWADYFKPDRQRKSAPRKYQGPQSGQSSKLPQCLVGFLNRNALGYDWSKVTLRQGSTWGGRRASTSLNTVTYKNWNSRNDLSLTFHELGHLPQWSSGALTEGSYASESIGSWWSGDSWVPDTNAIWDQSAFEQEAELFRQTMTEAYKQEGSPCSPKK